MNEIQRTIDYYQLLIDKFEKTGLSPHQLKVYREIQDLVQGCSSYEDIQSKMKSQGYYESPGQALYLDAIMAQKNAAKQNGFTELEELYLARYNEVKADGSKMHVTGYSEKASSILSKYSTLMDALFEIYINYCTYNGANPYDTLRYNGSLDNIRKYHAVFQTLGTSFEEISATSYYRQHIGLEDDKYQMFISEVKTLLQKREPERSEIQPFEEELKLMWPKLKDKRVEVQAIGKLEDAKTKKSIYLVVAPSDNKGKYTFTSNQQEEY